MLSKISHINCSNCIECKYRCSYDLPALLISPTMVEEICEPVAAFTIDYIDSQAEQLKQIYELYLETRGDIVTIRRMVPETTCEQIRHDLYMFFCNDEVGAAFNEWKSENSISERAQHFLELSAIIKQNEALADREIHNDYRIFHYLFDSKERQRKIDSCSD